MTELTAIQLRLAFAGLTELSELRDDREFPARTAALLRTLIPCDNAACTLVDPRSGSASIAADPADSVFPGAAEVFARFAHQNPLVDHYARTGDGRALRFSDLSSRRELHATDLYNHVYRVVEVEHQLAVTVRSPLHPGAMIGLTVSRRGHDFTATECDLLDLLGPHLRATLRHLGELALAEAMLVSADRADAGATALIDDGWIVIHANLGARDAGLSVGQRLPPAMRSLCAAGAGPSVLELGGVRVRVRLVRDVRPGVHALRVTPACRGPDAESLRRLGLTGRQAEILALAVDGSTSAQLGFALGVSTRTIEKHLEAVYTRLGVSGRAQAIVRALEQAS